MHFYHQKVCIFIINYKHEYIFLFLYSHCNIVHPSWAELAQFVRFLYVQLNDCQCSIYCNQEFFGEGTDFKKFVVEFMIRMSQVCYLHTYILYFSYGTAHF